MIRHLAILTLNPGTADSQIRSFETALRQLNTPGLISLRCGRDLGLMKSGTLDAQNFAIVADFVDVGAFRRYDSDEEHLRIRKQYSAPMTRSAVRAQFEI